MPVCCGICPVRGRRHPGAVVSRKEGDGDVQV